MVFNLPLFIVLAAGSAQSIFIGCCLLSPRQKTIREFLLAALLLASGIRLLKSILFIFDNQLSLYVINVGFAAHAATPVFLWLYVQSLASSQLSRKHLLHLLPAVLIISVSGVMTLQFWYRGAYLFLIYYSICYYAWSAFELLRLLRKIKSNPALRPVNLHWIVSLFVAVGVFISGYFVNYNLGFISYEMAPLPYAIVVFPLGYVLWKHYHQINMKRNPKYEHAMLSPAKMAELTERLDKVLENQKPYLDPKLTVGGLSKLLNIPPYILSQVLNVHLSSSFPVLINACRVQHACRLLENPEFASLSIASIAYEAGFNSLSVFNKVFKEIKGVAPNRFRKNTLPD